MKRYKPKGKYRFAAEWEHPCSVLMAWPAKHTDWNFMLEQAQEQCRRLVCSLLKADQRVILLCPDTEDSGMEHPLLFKVTLDYNDTWTRDYGPITVAACGSMRLLDFGFNAWGLKFAADLDNLATLKLCDKGVLPEHLTRNCRNFILEGGSIETDGQGTLLTTTRCLCSPNRNGGLSKNELNELLGDYLGVDHVLWLDYGFLEGDDTDSHIDTLARMAPDNCIVYTGAGTLDDAQAESLRQMAAQLKCFRTAQGDPFNLMELPLPDPVYADGERLPATYANYLVTPDNLFMPTYNQPLNDNLAAKTLQAVFQNHNIVGVDCCDYLRQHGSLHCATMQIPLTALNITTN